MGAARIQSYSVYLTAQQEKMCSSEKRLQGDKALLQILSRLCIFFLRNGALMNKTQLTEAFKEPVKFSWQADGRKGSCLVSEEQVATLPLEKQGRGCQWIEVGVLHESGLKCSFDLSLKSVYGGVGAFFENLKASILFIVFCLVLTFAW